MKVVIRMPNWLGDAIMATPLLAIARKRWPKAHLAVLTKCGLAPLYKHNPHINAILTDESAISGFDVGILTTNSFSSAWQLFKRRVKKRIGFRGDCRSFLLNNALPFPKERGFEHLVKTYKRLLDSDNEAKPELFVSPGENRLPRSGKPILGINAQAAYGPAKCWLPERFRDVAKRMSEDYTVVFFGDASGEQDIAKICQGLDVVNLAGKTTLRELIGSIAACDLFLTNDSGPMHIAAAVKTPLVALFGSTNDVATGPYEFGRVIHKRVPCSPCYKRVCPIDFPCMHEIGVDEVINALRLPGGESRRRSALALHV